MTHFTKIVCFILSEQTHSSIEYGKKTNHNLSRDPVHHSKTKPVLNKYFFITMLLLPNIA